MPTGVESGEIGGIVSLTGRYSVQGAQARVGLEAWAAHSGHGLRLVDDESRPERAALLHEELISAGCGSVIGPYGSDSTRAVATNRAGKVVWNHGAAADDVQRLPGVVSVPSPASSYLVALGRVVAARRPGAVIAVLTAPGRFASFAGDGILRKAPSLGLTITDNPKEADAVLLCGPIQWEIKLLRSLTRRHSQALIGGVSPGLASFPQLLDDDPDGLLAPVQWFPDIQTNPHLGPSRVRLDEYPAAQAYAVALIAQYCTALNPKDPLTVAMQLDTTTFFGRFKLAADGTQAGHNLGVIQWRNGRRELLTA